MSGLTSMALRMAVRFMLLNATSAGDRVFDSPVDPFGMILDQSDPSEAPLIAVYVHEVSGKPSGRMITPNEAEIELVVWTYLTPAKVSVSSVSLEVRESGAALANDLMSVQVSRALRFAPDRWREVFEEVVHTISKVVTRSVLVESENGVRIPASEMIITCKAIPEPAFGRPISGAWLKLDAAMRQEPHVAGLADLVKNLIEGPAGLPAWRVMLGEQGLSKAEGRAIGIVPLDATETGEPSLLLDIDTPGGTDTSGPSTIPT